MMDLVVFGLVANKSDKPNWKVTEEEGRKFADENGFYFGITSAKTGEGVKNFFDSIINISLINNVSQLQTIIKLQEEEENYKDDDELIDKEIYCNKCKLIPFITLSKHLNINIKCGCGERENVLIEDYIKSLPSIYDNLELNRNCFNHPEKRGNNFCYECYKFLCVDCLERHDKEHKLIIKDGNYSLEECDYHKYKKAKYYSQENKKYLCLLCFVLKEKENEEIDNEFFSANNTYKENLSTTIKIIKTLKEDFNVTKEKEYLIKIFTIKDMIEEYKLRYPYVIKLHKIMVRMKGNNGVNNYFPKLYLKNNRGFVILSFEGRNNNGSFIEFFKDLYGNNIYFNYTNEHINSNLIKNS